jgi:hypothetical protein
MEQPTTDNQLSLSRDVIRPGDRFQIGAARYWMDEFGVIHQAPPFTPPTYDEAYVATRYDTIPESVLNLSYVRVGYVLAVCGPVRKVLDIGYGNGGFLRAMHGTGAECAGSDVSGYPLPPGVRAVAPDRIAAEAWSLVTFYDSLEHFPTLDILTQLRTDWLAITAPCVPEDVTVEWLAGWKHLRPGEHLHHFSPTALARLLDRTAGYRLVDLSYVEDVIRRPVTPERNIFTAIFHREQY